MGVVLRKASEFQARGAKLLRGRLHPPLPHFRGPNHPTKPPLSPLGHLLMLQGVEPLLNLLKSGSMNTPASLFLVTGERGGMHVPRDAGWYS